MQFKKKALIIAFLLSFVYFIIHLVIINDYGFSWDFHYHFYAGLYHLGLPVPSINEPPPVPFTPPDPRLSVDNPFGPFTQIIPTISYLLLYGKWHILPADSAYNFPMVFIGSAGIGVLFLFLYESAGMFIALLGSFFLALLPNYFGYLHNNMKDIPNAFAFTLSVYLFWRLVRFRRVRDLIPAVLTFAFAFNIKINSVMIPVVCLMWFLFPSPRGRRLGLFFCHPRGVFKALLDKKYRLVILYFIFSPVGALLVWWPFWEKPLAKLLELPYFFSHNTINMPVLFLGKIVRSGVNIPITYPYVYLVITTPIPILIGFIAGIVVCINKILNSSKLSNICSLFLLWFFIPLVRYLDPKTGAIDGVRHFMEVVYPFCAIAAVGWGSIYFSFLRKRNWRIIGIFIGIIIFFLLLKPIVDYHPYQTSYFNALIGGIKGAEGKFDIDFWGTPQKEAMFWLNQNAPNNATINILMAQSSAATYLRPDLRKLLNTKDIWESEYSVILNRESFFYSSPGSDYIKKKIKENKLVFTRRIDGVSLVWVFVK